MTWLVTHQECSSNERGNKYQVSSIFEEASSNKEVAILDLQVQFNKIIPEMHLFDIDGVITEPMTGAVAFEVVDAIVDTLERDEPVAFNTGRGLNWILRDILPHFEARLSKRSVMNKLCIVYQKGAYRVAFNEKGELEMPVAAPDVVLPPNSLRTEVQELIDTKYSASMFPGEKKEAVLSPQMRPGVDLEIYKAEQAKLVEDLQEMLLQYGLDTQFRVDPTRIATDVEDKRLGKALGARQILIWLAERGLQPQYFIAFGDSQSDVGMAEEIYHNGFFVDFVFVGGKELLKEMPFPFRVIFTQMSCEKGTLEYLKSRPRHI